jgi:hypothetical protein
MFWGYQEVHLFGGRVASQLVRSGCFCKRTKPANLQGFLPNIKFSFTCNSDKKTAMILTSTQQQSREQ